VLSAARVPEDAEEFRRFVFAQAWKVIALPWRFSVGASHAR
jgi:hypothetical protein